MVAVKVSRPMPETQFSSKKQLQSSAESSFSEIMDKMANEARINSKESFNKKTSNTKKDFENEKNSEQAQEILAAQMIQSDIQPVSEQQSSEMSIIQGALLYQSNGDVSKAMAGVASNIAGLQNTVPVENKMQGQSLAQMDTGAAQINDGTVDISKLVNDILAKDNVAKTQADIKTQAGTAGAANNGIKLQGNQASVIDENAQKLFNNSKIASGSLEDKNTADLKGIIANDNKAVPQADKLSQGKVNLSIEKPDPAIEKQAQPQAQAVTTPHVSTLNPDNTNIKVGEAVQVKSETFVQDLSEKIIVNIKDGVKEFNIKLNPESLGSVTIKIVFEADKALITMGCENQKAQAALAQSSEAIKSIIQQNVGTQTIIIVQENPQQNYQQQQQSQQQSQQQQDSQQEQAQAQLEVEDIANFLNQLKLGLINT